jgi:RNA polymerase sigma-70 factor (ECF subfamily)
MRGIEEMSTAETAACLDLSEEAVKVRFHRARALLQERIDARVSESARDAFSFGGARCAKLTAAVTARLALRADRADA